jgi:hypothetical protein
LRAAVDQHLADKKIEANDIAGRITMNLRTMRAHGDYDFLFADLKQIVAKQAEDFQALVQSRVLAHQQEEQRREEATRERIRQEEEQKAREKVAAEQREQQEREAAAQRAQAVPASTPAAPIPPMAAIHAPASNTPLPQKVTPITRPQGKPTLRLGEINERLAPLSISEAGLAKLGFPAAGKDRSAVLFHEADFEAMCDSIVAHVRTAQQHQHEAEAA